MPAKTGDFMNKLHIAIKLIKLMNEKKTVTTKQVAEELEVSQRTAQRYMSDMSYLPGICYDTEACHWFLTEKYELSDSYLSKEELHIMSALFDYAKNISGGSSGLIDKLKRKIITASVNKPVVHILSESAVDFSSVSDTFEALEQHIDARSEISFYYIKKDKSYTAYPYKIIYSDGFWYLAAEHEGILKKFSADKIQNIAATGNKYKTIPEWAVEELNNAKSIFFGGGRLTEVTAEIHSKMADYFVRKPFFQDQKIIGNTAEGNLIITFNVGNMYECMKMSYDWLPYIKILSPDSFRDYFKTTLKESLDFHAETDCVNCDK